MTILERGAVVGALLLALATSSAAAAPLRVASQGSLTNAPAVIADRQGFFKQEGLEVEFVGTQADGAASGARPEIGSMSERSFLASLDAKVPVVAVAVGANACGATHIAVPKDSPIKDLRQLKGKKIGLPPSTMPAVLFASRVAPAAGLKPGEYTATTIAHPKARTANLVAKQVDAAILNEPAFSAAESEGVLRSLDTFCAYDPLPYVVTASGKTLRERPDAVAAFLRAWIKAVKLLKDDPAKAAAAYVDGSKSRGIPAPVLDRALRRFKWEGEITPEVEQHLVAAAKLLQESGGIKAVPDVAKAIDRESWRKAVKPSAK